MRVASLILCLLATIVSAIAQERVMRTTSVKSGFLGVSFAHELTLGANTTLNLEGGLLNGSVANRTSYDGNGSKSKWEWSLPLELIVEPRYYYNLKKRSLDSKNVVNNSANFLSIMANYSSSLNVGNISNSPYILLAPQFGIRRRLGKSFFIEGEVGCGFYRYVSNSNTELNTTPMLSLKVGLYIMGKLNK